MGKFFSELVKFTWPLLAGYFVNDAVEITNNVTKASPDPNTGRPRWWVVTLAILAMAVIVWIGFQIIGFFFPKSKK